MAPGLGRGLEGRRPQPSWSRCGGPSACRSRPPTGSTSSSTPRRSRPPAAASLASEILRGLGYWYFYGTDRVGPWTQTVGGLHPGRRPDRCASFTRARSWPSWPPFVARWRYRAYFILITVVGMVLAVGPNPYDRPVERRLGDQEDHGGHHGRPGHALDRPGLPADHPQPGRVPRRRGQRAGRPGAQDRAGHRGRSPWPPWPGPRRPCGRGQIIANGFTQPAAPPAYVRQAAAALDKTHPATRVYALPGQQLRRLPVGRHHRHRLPRPDDPAVRDPRAADHGVAAHRRRPRGRGRPAPGRRHGLERPGPDGVPARAPGTCSSSTTRPTSATTPPTPSSWPPELATTPAGPDRPGVLRHPAPERARSSPTSTRRALALPANQGWPAPLVSYTVTDPRPIVRTESTATPLVVDGDANGVVAAASVGLLAGNPTILYAGTLDTDRTLRRRTLSPARRPGGHRHQPQAGLPVEFAQREHRLHRDGGPGSRHRPTRATHRSTCSPRPRPTPRPPRCWPGSSSVTASSYGSSITYLPEDRPAAALDGNPQTGVADRLLRRPSSASGGRWSSTGPAPSDSLHLVQPQTGDPDRHITRVTLTFDGGAPGVGPASAGLADRRRPGGHLPGPDLHHPADHHHRRDRRRPDVTGRRRASSVGFAEVAIPGVTVDETVVDAPGPPAGRRRRRPSSTG